MRRMIPMLLAAGLAGAPCAALADYTLGRSVICNGGSVVGGISGSGKVSLGTVGQWAVGASAGTGRRIGHGFWCSLNATFVSVDPPTAPELPPLSFAGARPNPTEAAVSFGFTLPRPARVEMNVLDIQGRVITRLVRRSFPAGAHSATWNGLDDSGAPVESGVYFTRMLVDGIVAGTRRVVVRR